MLKKTLKSSLIATSIFLTSISYAQDEPTEPNVELVNNYSYDNENMMQMESNGGIDDIIVDLADNLLASSRIAQSDMGNIAITSFVDLHNLDETTAFGRIISETFFNELFIRGFNVADFRGQKALTVKETGEFYLTRNVKHINKKIKNSYVLVGTYTAIGERILLNARIMDNLSGRVVAAAKTYYETDDCKLLGNCKKPRMIKVVLEDSNSFKNKKSTPQKRSKQIRLF